MYLQEHNDTITNVYEGILNRYDTQCVKLIVYETASVV
jgi:hypothetical protein